MKTAEEWVEEHNNIGSAFDIDETLIPLLKQIQLDAWKEGLTIASKACDSYIMEEAFNEGDWHMSHSAKEIKEKITELRDSKTTI